jgi:hypothetical protein
MNVQVLRALGEMTRPKVMRAPSPFENPQTRKHVCRQGPRVADPFLLAVLNANLDTC